MTRVAAVGAGRMGRGLAVTFAMAGHPVALIDLKPRESGAYLDDAEAEIAGTLKMLAACGLIAAEDIPRIAGRIGYVAETDAEEVMAGAEVIFEGVPETLDAKETALARISAADNKR